MKITLLIAASFFLTHTQAQQITGRWFSAGSSRVYEIRPETGSTLEAVVISSSRRSDSAGFIAIKSIQYNQTKKRYEGVMYAASGSQPCAVKITASGNQLVLKLSRMFLFDAVLRWNRDAAVTAAAE